MADAATPDTATASESLDLDGAARAIEKLLDREEGAGRNDPRRRRASAAQATSATEDERGDHPDSTQGDDAGEEPEIDSSEDEQPRYTVKIDGEEQAVTLDELIKGYQRGADYTRKTMRIGEERRSLQEARHRNEAELAAAQGERQLYAQQLDAAVPALREQLLAQFGGIDWARLAAEDPVRFAQLSPAFERMSAELQRAEAAQLRLRQDQERQHQQLRDAYNRHIAGEKRALIERHPELRDPARYRQEMAAVSDYLLGSGYSRHELQGLTDHRDMILVRKAMLYDRMARSKGEVADRLGKLPRVQQPGAARGRGEGGRDRRAALMQRLKSTGRAEDAVRLIEDML